jgi:hypothetical protein
MLTVSWWLFSQLMEQETTRMQRIVFAALQALVAALVGWIV